MVHCRLEYVFSLPKTGKEPFTFIRKTSTIIIENGGDCYKHGKISPDLPGVIDSLGRDAENEEAYEYAFRMLTSLSTQESANIRSMVILAFSLLAVYHGWLDRTIAEPVIMLALADEKLEKCLFVSPVLDMEQLILNMMRWADVTEEQLQHQKIIPTNFGQTLSWEYLCYVRQHPVTMWNVQTDILYAGRDDLTQRNVVDAFVDKYKADLSVMEDGEHWFHTPEQLAVLDEWTRGHI